MRTGIGIDFGTTNSALAGIAGGSRAGALASAYQTRVWPTVEAMLADSAVDAVLVGNRQAPHKRAALVTEKVLEPRREWWTQAAAWAACILYRAGNDERWQEFYALASAMAQGRALKEIPLMYKVASQTVSAWEHRLDG